MELFLLPGLVLEMGTNGTENGKKRGSENHLGEVGVIPVPGFGSSGWKMPQECSGRVQEEKE